MTIYEIVWCAEQGKYLVHGVYNGNCANFSSTDNYAIGSTFIAKDGIMIKYAASTWAKYEG